MVRNKKDAEMEFKSQKCKAIAHGWRLKMKKFYLEDNGLSNMPSEAS